MTPTLYHHPAVTVPAIDLPRDSLLWALVDADELETPVTACTRAVEVPASSIDVELAGRAADHPHALRAWGFPQAGSAELHVVAIRISQHEVTVNGPAGEWVFARHRAPADLGASPLPQAQRVLVIGAPRALLQDALDRGALVARPARMNLCRAATVAESAAPDPGRRAGAHPAWSMAPDVEAAIARVNLLVGAMTPAPVVAARRRARRLRAWFSVVALAAISVGCWWRDSQARRGVQASASEAAEILALGASETLDGLRAVIHRLEQQRLAVAKAPPRADESLAAVLAAWPREHAGSPPTDPPRVLTHHINVGADAITIQLTAERAEDATALLEHLRATKGFTLQPAQFRASHIAVDRVVTTPGSPGAAGADAVHATLRLVRDAEGEGVP